MKAMERIEEIRAKRERVFTRRRLSGKAQRDKKRREDLKVVAEGEHLIRKELQDLEMARQEGVVDTVTLEQESGRLVGEERLRLRAKRKMLVDGGTVEEMDVD
jgi:large subunit ribosomal protein L24e